MVAPVLDERRKEVLRSLIQLHVETGEPVGSESLPPAPHRPPPPATLHTIMAHLEALGYLDHPHTSAGRIPTDEGYRLYVDSLMRHRDLAPAAAAAIRSERHPPRPPRGPPPAPPRPHPFRPPSPGRMGGPGDRHRPPLAPRLSRHVGFV